MSVKAYSHPWGLLKISYLFYLAYYCIYNILKKATFYHISFYLTITTKTIPAKGYRGFLVFLSSCLFFQISVLFLVIYVFRSVFTCLEEQSQRDKVPHVKIKDTFSCILHCLNRTIY